jgi:hypothetical protein
MPSNVPGMMHGMAGMPNTSGLVPMPDINSGGRRRSGGGGRITKTPTGTRSFRFPDSQIPSPLINQTIPIYCNTSIDPLMTTNFS